MSHYQLAPGNLIPGQLENSGDPCPPDQTEGSFERKPKRLANRGTLPAHLPRIETVVDVADLPWLLRHAAPDWRGCVRAPRHRAGPVPGAGRTPAQMRLPDLRGYGGPSAGAADRRRAARDATVAQVLVSKYADHLPLYRQALGRALTWIARPWPATRSSAPSARSRSTARTRTSSAAVPQSRSRALSTFESLRWSRHRA